MLKTTLPDSALSLPTVTWWFNKFKSDFIDVKVQHCKGRQITQTSQVNIERVRVIVKNDPERTFHEIKAKKKAREYSKLKNKPYSMGTPLNCRTKS